MNDLTSAEVSAYYSVRVPGLNQRGREWRYNCPVHRGKDPNFTVSPETGMAHCHSQCSKGWDVVGLEMEITTTSFAKAKASVYRIIGRAEVPYEERDIEAIYDYTNEEGETLYQVIRSYGKKFRQRQPRGGQWIWSLGGVQLVPFQLPKVMDAEFVAITEGEKDALALTRLGIVGTCNNGGAGHFGSNLAQWFKGKRIAIFPDNDDPGRKHALMVAELLSNVAKSVRIVELPNLPQKGDVSDFILKEGAKAHAKILERYQRASDWSPDWEFSAEVPDEDEKYVRTFAQVIEECGGLDQFWDLATQEGRSTPYPKLTQAMGGGLRDGEVYVIGGNQGSGKTSLALQFGAHTMLAGDAVLIFEMEMSWRDVFQRMASIDAWVDLMELREAQKMQKERKDFDEQQLHAMRYRLQKSTSRLCHCDLFVSNRARVTPEYLLKESVRIGKRQKLGLIIVDHMQLMGSGATSERSEYEKFTAISRAVKETAMELKRPVLLVSQTSRNNSSGAVQRELEVSDLRGSGAIEEDAAAVMLVYPDADHKKQLVASQEYASGPVRSWLKLGKNRYGMQGQYLPLMHFKKYTRFEYSHELVREEYTG